MKNLLKNRFLFFLFLTSLFLFGFSYQAKAFSFLNFFEQVKNKIINPQEEKIVKEIKAKKLTLKKTIELIDKNSQEELNLFAKYCPLPTSTIEGSSTKDIFKAIITLYQPLLDASESTSSTSTKITLQASSTNSLFSSTTFPIFDLFNSKIKEKILFDQKVCSSFLFLQKENNWYNNFENALKDIKTPKEINKLIENLKKHRSLLKEEDNSISEIAAVLRSLENISIAKNRAKKISSDLKIIDLDEFSQKIIAKLFVLAKTKIKIASLETQKAKLIILYLESFNDIWPEIKKTSATSSLEVSSSTKATSSPTKVNSQILAIKNQIALQIKLEKEKIIPSPIDLLNDSQEYLKSAYQDFSFISKLAQKD